VRPGVDEPDQWPQNLDPLLRIGRGAELAEPGEKRPSLSWYR
jgi:hypothetical protein